MSVRATRAKIRAAIRAINAVHRSLTPDWYTCKYQHVVEGSCALMCATGQLEIALDKLQAATKDEPGYKPPTREEEESFERFNRRIDRILHGSDRPGAFDGMSTT